jgi:hypothetical protein
VTMMIEAGVRFSVVLNAASRWLWVPAFAGTTSGGTSPAMTTGRRSQRDKGGLAPLRQILMVRSAATPRVSNHEAEIVQPLWSRAVASILRDASLRDAPQDEARDARRCPRSGGMRLLVLCFAQALPVSAASQLALRSAQKQLSGGLHPRCRRAGFPWEGRIGKS